MGNRDTAPNSPPDPAGDTAANTPSESTGDAAADSVADILSDTDANSASSVPTIMCRDDQFRLYIDSDTIQQRVEELGEQITADYKERKPILIGVLNGAFMFMADLMRSVDIACEVDFMKLSSYGDRRVSSGEVEELKKIDAELSGRHVIVVEDIVDTGLSMEYMLKGMQEKNPASIEIATLLHKEEATDVELDLKYVGFAIDNLFVIGYGMDYGQIGRNLREIYILDE